jgi:hypothetical protein
LTTTVNRPRRQLLATLLAGGLLPSFLPSLGRAATSGPAGSLTVLRQWASANTLLAPLTQHEGQVFFAGNRTVGRIDPEQAQPVWNTAHGLSKESVFRPRVASQLVLAGSQT